MTTVQERILELSTALESELVAARARMTAAEESMNHARIECEAAKSVLQLAEQQLAGLRRAFPDALAGPSREGPQLVVPDFATMTMSQKVQHVLGDRTMTLDELCAGLEAQKLVVPNLQQVLYKTKHNVIEKGKPTRDKAGVLVKRNTFVSPQRGRWCVAEPEPPEPIQVLTPSNVKFLHRK